MSRRIAIALVLSLAAVVGAGSPADAHRGSHSAAKKHAKNDLATTPVSVLERRARAKARALGRKPGTRSKRARARARASAVTDPGVVGRWSEVKPMPVVPVAEALLPNGKVLMWDSVGDAPGETYDDHTYTRAAVYDPVTDTSKRVDVRGTNVFCAGFVQLANGNVFVAGGNADSSLRGSRTTHTFDWTTETWTRGPDMQDGRWYPSVAASPTDEAVIIGGGPTVAEVRTSGGAIRRLTGVTTPSSRLYPFLQGATDGRSLLLGAPPSMSLVDPFGTGSIAAAGTRDALDRDYGSFAPYDVGRTLVAGGGSVTVDGVTGPARSATIVDTRSGSPVGRATGSMVKRRRQHHLTTLADGSVLATGGQTTDGGFGQVDLANAAYEAERWNPATGAWTALAPAAVARQYHTTAVLLPDGRVMSGGGGICAVCQEVGYFRRDAEIFSPPYLFKRDGSGALAPRPELSAVPREIGFDRPFTVSSPQAGQIRKLGLVRLGAPTHGVDQGQRYIPLGFTASGTTLNASGPANPNEAPAGYYMLFAVDADGVPSVASMVSVQRTGAVVSNAGVNLARGKAVTSSPPCDPAEGPEKAVNGSVSGGIYDKWCSRVTNPSLTVDLGSSQAVGSFTVRHAGAGGEPASFNTRDFRIETSLDGTTWSAAANVTGNTASSSTHTIATRQARYVRLTITYAEQTAALPARIYEFEVYGVGAASVPLTAYSKPSASGRAQRFEAGAFDAARGNLGQVGNDQIRSLDVAPGYQVTLCRQTGLAECTTLPAGRHTSLPTGYDRTVSSLRVTKVG